MARTKGRTKKIVIQVEQGTFSSIISRFRGKESHKDSDIAMLRSILNTEKARIMHILKVKQPNSIYELAKLLGRDFKSVREDVLLLQKLGVVELIPVHKGKREKLKPLLVINALDIKINL